MPVPSRRGRVCRAVLLRACLLLALVAAYPRAAAPPRPLRARTVAMQPVPVLMYHHVRYVPQGAPEEAGNTVTPPTFAEQMALLRLSGWHSVSLGQVMAARAGGEPLPEHPVVLTFDDGYTDFATEAVPMMRAAGFTGTDYVISGMVGAPDHMPLDLLVDVARRGNVIGGHTVHHADLPTLSGGDALRELQESRAALQRMTGQPVGDFAYPFGHANPGVEALVARAGFQTATVECCGGVGGGSDPFALPRIRAGQESLQEFASSLGIGVPPAADRTWWWSLHRAGEAVQHGGWVGIAASPLGDGYALLRWDGVMRSFGDRRGDQAPDGWRLSRPVVAASDFPAGGYWTATVGGDVAGLGEAVPLGGVQGAINAPVVGMATSPMGFGYWLVAADGGVFAFGDAPFLGSTGSLRLNAPVVGMAATPDGGGYWLVSADGGVFTFGDARFWGSTGGLRLNAPVVGLAATPDGGGYWLVAADGGVFPFGDAAGLGSVGGQRLNAPVVGMATTFDGGGYRLLAADGGVFCFGNAEMYGSAVS